MVQAQVLFLRFPILTEDIFSVTIVVVNQLSDDKDFDKVVDDLETIQKDIIQSIKEASPSIIKQLQNTFNKGSDPYGKPWERIENPGDITKPLYETGNLFNSFVSRNVNDGIEITNTAQYSSYVNNKRNIIPEEKDLPKEMLDILEKAVAKAIDSKFK